MNTRGKLHTFIHIFFPAGRSTKHLVDWLLADYIGVNQGSRHSDKCDFVLASV